MLSRLAGSDRVASGMDGMGYTSGRFARGRWAAGSPQRRETVVAFLALLRQVRESVDRRMPGTGRTRGRRRASPNLGTQVIPRRYYRAMEIPTRANPGRWVTVPVEPPPLLGGQCRPTMTECGGRWEAAPSPPVFGGWRSWAARCETVPALPPAFAGAAVPEMRRAGPRECWQSG